MARRSVSHRASSAPGHPCAGGLLYPTMTPLTLGGVFQLGPSLAILNERRTASVPH